MDKKVIIDKIQTLPKQGIYIAVIAVIAIIIIFLIIGFTIGRYNPDPTSETIQNLVNTQIATEKEKYKQTIKEKEDQNKILQQQLDESARINNGYKTEIDKLKKKEINIKKPKTESEIRKRLKEAGYETH